MVRSRFLKLDSGHVGYDNGKLAGIIEWNVEDCEMIGREGQSVNVGEAFVYPSYRETGLAEKLHDLSI